MKKTLSLILAAVMMFTVTLAMAKTVEPESTETDGLAGTTVHATVGEYNAQENTFTVILYDDDRFDIDKIENVFYENSIDKIYLNFSDPWPKKRHESRRLTHLNFLNKYEKILKNGAMIEFKTDNVELFDFSIEEINKSNFKIISKTYDLHSDQILNKDNIMTEYEEKFSSKGNKICKLTARVIK